MNTLSLPEKFTIVIGLKITKCPKRNHAVIFSTGPGGYEFLIAAAHGKFQCTLKFRKYNSDEIKSIVDMNHRPRFIED